MDIADYQQVQLENVSFVSNSYIVFLKAEGEANVLPICIGQAEAHAILVAYNGQPFPRPLTHDLVKNILSTLDSGVEKVLVNDLKNGTFYARVFLQRNGETIEIDSRPSDAIALALRFEAPIYVRQDILSENSVNLQQSTPEPSERRPKRRMPTKGAGREPKSPSDPREQLEEQLAKAVREERYEDAARIRDQLEGFSE